MTASAASIVAPPANTAKRAKASASRAFSRRWLQSIVARRVRWRSGASRGPLPRPSSTGARRAFSSWTSSSVVRAAASSMASGSPSRWRQISATALGVVVGQLEASVVAAGALDEQRAGRGLRDGARVGLCWEFERGDGVALLGLQSQRLAAGRDHGQRRSGGQQLADQRGRRQQVLEVVEHQQPVLRAEETLDRMLEGLPLEWRDAHGLCDRARNVLDTGGRGERNEPGAVPILALKPPRHLERQPRLPHPARPGERDQAGLVAAQ